MREVRRGLVLLAIGSVAAGGAAQERDPRLPPGAVVQPLPESGGAELRRHLTALAENPRSLEALIGAGRAAMATGDAEAALAFFGRADETAPRDARVKAGMASAFVRLGQAQAALSLFAQAAALGAPEIEIAGDRGLAFDMAGDPRRAQQEYALVLRRRDDPEVRRRMALSLAISGEREAALRTIDAQLRANDRAAWRVQAFVLALTGDAAGAGRTAQRVMPGGGAQAMAPFFARLAALSPAQKAMAVHFGHFPAGGRVAAAPVEEPAADPGAVALAMGGAPPVARTDPRRREPARTRQRPGAALDSSDPYRLREPRRVVRPPPPRQRPEQRADVAGIDTRWAPPPSAPAAAAEPEPEPLRSLELPPSGAAPAVAAAGSSPGFSLVPSLPPAAAGDADDEGLAEIAALVESLPPDPAPAAEPTPRAEPRRTRTERTRPAPPAHPARHWVQIAGGADRAALPREFARLRALAPDELGRRSAWTTPLRATNRLLVGPFASADAAQEFVNRLARRDVAAFAWTSEAGQEIERLQTGR